MTAQQELQNKRVAGFTTAGIFAVFFVLMFYIIIWSPGNPPAFEGGSGIELNFGTADAGFGDVQPTEQVGDNAGQSETPAQSEEQSTPSQEQPEANTPQQTPVKTDEDVQDIKSEEESPVKVTPPKKETVKEPAKVKETPKKEEPKKEEPKANPATTFSGGKTTATNQKATGDGKTGAAGNHGDQPGTTGDQGNPQGKLDADALYGNPGKGGPGPGGEGGVGLEMSGWTWDNKPKAPELKDNDSGFVIFEITIDAQGEIIATRVVERTLSPDAVKRCEEKLRDVSFVRTANSAAPAQSKGKVRFNLVVR